MFKCSLILFITCMFEYLFSCFSSLLICCVMFKCTCKNIARKHRPHIRQVISHHSFGIEQLLIVQNDNFQFQENTNFLHLQAKISLNLSLVRSRLLYRYLLQFLTKSVLSKLTYTLEVFHNFSNNCKQSAWIFIKTFAVFVSYFIHSHLLPGSSLVSNTGICLNYINNCTH